MTVVAKRGTSQDSAALSRTTELELSERRRWSSVRSSVESAIGMGKTENLQCPR